MVYNPSLRQLPRNQLAPVIPFTEGTSILSWLEDNHRLIPRDPQEDSGSYLDEEEEISELMGGDDGDYVDDDDDLDD